MRCSVCDAPLAVTHVFPGGSVRCACGAENVVPTRARDRAVPSHNAPYREAHAEREAAILECPFCGAPCSPDVRACPHCDVSLVSVRCPHCFALHFSGARYCARCGKELELEPLLDASDAPCPRCDKPLAASGTPGMFECASCGGLFVDNGAFVAITAEGEARAHHANAIAPAPPSLPFSSRDAVVRYVKCPMCHTLMNRTNYGKRSGVIVDVCKMHGIWFDAGELTRVVEFVAAGGLEETRRRESEEREESRSKATRAAAELQVAMMQEGYREQRALGRDAGAVDTLVDVILAFFRGG